MNPLPLEGLQEWIRDLVRTEVRAVLSELAPPSSGLLSTADAARVAGVTPGTIRRWVREKRLDDHGAGHEVRVRASALGAIMLPGRKRALRLDASATEDLSTEAISSKVLARLNA